MKKAIVIMIFCCIILSYIEYSSNEYLEETSKILIQLIQQIDYWWLRLAFHYIDQITGVCFLILSGYLYLTHNTENGFLCIIAGYSGAAFSGILKSIFSHPRPLWKYEEIKAMACPRDWGSPSGHSMAAGTPLIVILLLILQQNYSKKYFITVLLSLFLTTFTRLYIGAHFFFQIVLGFAFSALLALILVSIHLKKLFKFTNLRFTIKVQILMGILIIISIVLINIQEPLWKKFWTENFESKCPGSLSNEKAQSKALMDSLLWSNIAGLSVGRYFLGPGEFKSTSKLLSLALFALSIYTTLILDQILNQNLIILLTSRYMEGIFIGFVLPKLLCSKSKE